MVGKANELLDKVLSPEKTKTEKITVMDGSGRFREVEGKHPTPLATADDLAAIVHKADLDLSEFDRAERDLNVYVAKINRDSINRQNIVLERMAREFAEVAEINPGLFVARSVPDPFVDHLGLELYRLAEAKTVEVMTPHVAPLNKLFAELADVIEAAADSTIESEHQAFVLAESERESKARAAFDTGARHRFLNGHDDHTFTFVQKTFTPSSLPARLVATAAKLRETRFVPKWGHRPSTVLNGLLSKALLEHPGK
jgi:hypothetical protein